MKSPLPYIGGKSRVAKRLIEHFPPHHLFVELFGGAAQLLCAKEPSPVEVYNDLDNEIANFFRVCQFHYEELIRYFRFALVSRTWFEILKQTDPVTLTDIQRAFRTLYLQKNCFGGRVVNPNFHYFRAVRPNFNPDTIADQIEKMHKRLARVQIESLPYQQAIQKFDTKTAFFFVDPPYYNKPFYRHNFELKDYLELAERLANLKGKFLMTLNDHPEMRKVFSRFQISTISFAYTCLKEGGKKFTELLIRNY